MRVDELVDSLSAEVWPIEIGCCLTDAIAGLKDLLLTCESVYHDVQIGHAELQYLCLQARVNHSDCKLCLCGMLGLRCQSMVIVDED